MRLNSTWIIIYIHGILLSAILTSSGTAIQSSTASLFLLFMYFNQNIKADLIRTVFKSYDNLSDPCVQVDPHIS